MQSKAHRWIPTREELSIVILLWALLMGAFVRWMPAWKSGFPINDGGMFYTMEQEIIRNQFRLPEFSSFNLEILPFAYPPLGLYVTAFLSSAFGISLLDLHRFLPAILGILSIPLMYLVAWTFLGCRWKASLATLAYAMIPQTNMWIEMGGGVTRGWGCLFSLFTIMAVWNLVRHRKAGWILPAAIGAAGLILSHLEWILDTAVWVILVMILYVRDWKTLFRLVLAGVLALVFTSPWWVTVLLRHGLTPFLSTMQTGGSGMLYYLSPLLILTFTAERYIDIIMVLALLGVLVSLMRRQGFLSLWMVVPFFVSYRNASLFVCIPVAMLAAIGLCDLLTPAILLAARKIQEAEEIVQTRISETRWAEIFLGSAWLKVALTFVLGYSLINSIHHAQVIESLRLSGEQLAALEWVSANTESGSRFVVLDNADFFVSPLSEWFPALTRQKNLLLLQGYEWLDGNRFFQRMAGLMEAQHCRKETEECLYQWARDRNMEFDYIWIFQGDYGAESNVIGNCGTPLIASLLESELFELAYKDNNTWIFRYTGPEILTT